MNEPAFEIIEAPRLHNRPKPLWYTYKTEPYIHQKRALAKVAKLDGRALLAMPMRTGKTKVAVDWASIAFHNHGLRRVLIVCPISVIDVWASEIEKHCPVPSSTWLLRSTAKKNATAMRWLATPAFPDQEPSNMINWVIVNYEMVWRQVDVLGPRGGHHRTHLDEVIADWQPDLVIADEAHKLKNPTSQQSKALARLGAVSPMRLALTGTPVTKAPLDLYGLFRFADPDTFEQKTWADFRAHYATWMPSRFDPRVPVVKRYENLDELVERTRAHSYRISLSRAFPDLPAKSYTNIRVPLPKNARRIYNTMAEEMIVELESGQIATADLVLEKLLRLSQITSGFIKDEEGTLVDIHDEKLDMLLDLVANMREQDEKAVVFCRFIHDYERISSRMTQGGISHVMLTGKETDRQKNAAVRQFGADPSVSVIVCQIQSGSLGIDLSAARMAIFYSLDYNWATYQQAQDRILDVRRPRPLGIYHLVCPNTVDVVQLRVLRRRGDVAEALIHSPRALLDTAWLSLPE